MKITWTPQLCFKLSIALQVSQICSHNGTINEYAAASRIVVRETKYILLPGLTSQEVIADIGNILPMVIVAVHCRHNFAHHTSQRGDAGGRRFTLHGAECDVPLPGAHVC